MTFITIAVLFSVLNLLTYSDTSASDVHAVLEAAPTPRLALLAEPPQRVPGAAATPPGAGAGASVRATADPDDREGRPGLAGASTPSRAPTQAAQGAAAVGVAAAGTAG